MTHLPKIGFLHMNGAFLTVLTVLDAVAVLESWSNFRMTLK